MENTLQDQIAAYQAIVYQARSAGGKLVQRLESLGWTMLERVFDYDGVVMISPELMSHEDWELTSFDDEEDWWNIDDVGKDEWSDHIVEILVIN